jgi:uncharacterized membrane protein (DUF485 family)
MDVTNGRSDDWDRIERLPEFRELVARRRRFVVPATVFFLVWYFGFVVLAGYAEDLMGTSIHEGFTVGYALALTQFVMVGTLGLWYLRYSERRLDPLRVRIAEAAGAPTAADEAPAADEHAVHGGRFDRPPPDAAPAPGPATPEATREPEANR